MNARPTGTRFLLAAAVVAALVIGAAGCSSDSKSSDDAKTSSTASTSKTRTDVGTSEADLKTAAAGYTSAKLDSSSASYDYLAPSCKDKYSASEWDSNVNQVTAILEQALPGISDAKVGTVAVRGVTPVAGEAQVTIVASNGSELIGAAKAEWDKWIVDNGMWVTTDCVAAADLIAGG